MQAVATNILHKARVLILGGGGLVGSAIAKHLGRLPASMRPSRVVVAALTQDSAVAAVQELQRTSRGNSRQGHYNEDTHITQYIPASGDIFVNRCLAHVSPEERKCNPAMRATMLNDMLGDFKSAYEQNYLVSMVREHKPHVIVDCINTATVLSYQDIYTASTRLRQAIAMENQESTSENSRVLCEEAEKTLLSLSTPQLIRHVRCLQEVSKEQQVQGYLKIGTTGTGGLGMNIPYTHSEDRPSRVLLSKSEAAFGHSGLLLLWSMTPGAPFVKELKPAAAIGYKSIDVRQVRDKHGNTNLYGGRLVSLEPSISESGSNAGVLSLREDPSRYPKLGPMKMPVIDMGENGCFTREEFLTITSPGQMELISPIKCSEMAIEELLSISTGHNILAAMRGSLLEPGYRAGINRMVACEQLEKLCNPAAVSKMAPDERPTAASVALGCLGPPELSKLLFEARVLANEFGTWTKLEGCDSTVWSQKFSLIATKSCLIDSSHHLHQPDTTGCLLLTAISVGVPILLHDNQLLRGPNISIPEPKGMTTDVPLSSPGHQLDTFACKGWVDLRTTNLERWKERARIIIEQQQQDDVGSDYLEGDWRVYKSNKGDVIDPPAVVAWILAVELGGHRDIG